jgi:hypothetical protein
VTNNKGVKTLLINQLTKFYTYLIQLKTIFLWLKNSILNNIQPNQQDALTFYI